jgi:hypothetical protein
MKKRNYNSNLNTNNIGSGIVNPDSYLPIMLLGISFILLGIALVLLPLLSKLPDVLEMMQNLPTHNQCNPFSVENTEGIACT